MKIFKSEAIRISAIYFLITRVALVLISYCVINEFALHHIVKNASYRFYENDLLNVWGNFDTGWYLKIAMNWYPNLQNTSSLSQTYSFFPLYPGIIRTIHFITGIDYFVIGLLVSNICLLISGALLYKIAEKFYSKEIANCSVIFLYLFPVSFIFSGMFSESLYVVLILSCFYFMQQKKWMGAGIVALLLTLSRPIGIFILLPSYFCTSGITSVSMCC